MAKKFKHQKKFRRLLSNWKLMLLLIGFSFSFFLFSYQQEQTQEVEIVSQLGKYKGYSQEQYDSWVRSSFYITMRDGVKLAADVIRPAVNGEVNEKPLPLIWTHTRYRRAVEHNGEIRSAADTSASHVLLKYGYILASVDVRGSGASFGKWDGIFTQEESRDAYEITEWFASQPWCDGNIGMSGGSYLGVTQLMAAGTKPPHLKAIFPMVAFFDLYEVGYPGGIFYDDLVKTWSELTQVLDTQEVAAPVDSDQDKKMLEAAVELHRSNRLLIDIIAPLKYRDSRDDSTGAYPYREWHPAGYIQEINETNIPIYLWCGWFDAFTKHGFLMLKNFSNPKKFIIGAWSHSPRDPEIVQDEFSLFVVEQLRWFDYWLKGIDNGIMDEPLIHYHLMKSPKKNEWKTARQWLLPEANSIKYYFHSGPSGSVESINDGILSSEAPESSQGKDEYTVDYTTTTGKSTRWDNTVGGNFSYPNMTKNDQKGLTYTTPPLKEDTEITGHPIVHLWISSTAEDGDFFVYLEEVEQNGKSFYITEGCLRASHRKIHEPPYEYMGLPFHRSYESDLVPLTPGEPDELVFDLIPTSNLFEVGNRIRVTITCADKDNALTPEIIPPPQVSIFRNAEQASFISLPIVTGRPEEEAETSFYLLYAMILLVFVLVIAFWFYFRSRIR